MAETGLNVSEATGDKLIDIFQNGLLSYEQLITKRDTSTDAELEDEVKKCMKQFELATQLVSAAALFSSNETLEDLSTETLKYLLLPAFLGMLSLRLVTQSRKEVVDIAQIYFKDFIKRCKEYAITDIELPSNEDEKNAVTNPLDNLTSKMNSREEKIKKYMKEKELNAKISQLKTVMQSENVDENSKREYYMTLIEYHIMKAVEELQYIKEELPLIEMMEKAKSQNLSPKKSVPNKPLPKLQPFIITKNDIQKTVFGQGYPSLPVYTVEEFYEQRVKDGSFPGGDGCHKSQAPNLNINTDDIDPNDLVEENKDNLIDTDDPVALQKARNMDEFRDEHKRGEGNRYNMS